MTTTGELKRYRVSAFTGAGGAPDWRCFKDDAGDWVKFADYDALRSRLDAAEKERDTYKRAYNDSTESADECRKMLARFDKSDSHGVDPLGDLVEQAVKALDAAEARARVRYVLGEGYAVGKIAPDGPHKGKFVWVGITPTVDERWADPLVFPSDKIRHMDASNDGRRRFRLVLEVIDEPASTDAHEKGE